MGGLGPGIGGMELVILAIVALVVVGPKDLPVMLRKVGQVVGRARKMAAEFRASFDDMARQSELDDLRKEVEALRQSQMQAVDFSPELDAVNAGVDMTPKPTPTPVAEPPAPDTPAPDTPAPDAPPPAKPRRAKKAEG